MPAVLQYETQRRPRERPLWPAYSCEALSSVGATLLQTGIFFYTQHHFGWGLRQNFLLACGQGAVYVIGSLSAGAIAARFGRRRGLIGIYAVMAVIALLAWRASTPTQLVPALLAYVLVSSMNWPVVESLVSAGADAHSMSRRVSIYNLVWSIANTITFAASGAIIEHWRGGLFLLPVMAHIISVAMMWRYARFEPPPETIDKPHEPPEPQLLAKRTLALWLARISLPATYVVVYSLMAMMPSLPVMQTLDTTMRTLVGSAWMGARVLTFIALGMTVWWHTRPRILLISAAMMLVAFLGVTIQPSEFLPGIPYAVDLASMVGWQIALGAVMGVIYSGSLYFGMVLSDGSTEHGGYHEALIGLGSIVGPGAGFVTQWRWPGDVRAGVASVSAVVMISLLAATIAAARARRKDAQFASPQPLSRV